MIKSRSFGLAFGLFAVAAIVLQALPAQAGIARGSFRQTNLVSNRADVIPTPNVIDPNLVNPWGLSSLPASPIWVSDNGTHVSTLYNTAGQKVPLTVNIPAPGAPPGGPYHGTPTGTVSNTTSAFVLPAPTGTAPSRFLFATQDGPVLGWVRGSKASIQVDTPDSGPLNQ